MVEDELIGGLMSGQFKRGTFTNAGYGIYLTEERIIGVKKSAGTALKEAVKGGGSTFLSERTMTDKEEKEIKSLIDENDFSIRHDEIEELNLKLPGLLRKGYLKIVSKNDEEIKIKIGKGITTSHDRDLRELLEKVSEIEGKLEII